jgi:hypothetical protein
MHHDGVGGNLFLHDNQTGDMSQPLKKDTHAGGGAGGCGGLGGLGGGCGGGLGLGGGGGEGGGYGGCGGLGGGLGSYDLGGGVRSLQAGARGQLKAELADHHLGLRLEHALVDGCLAACFLLHSLAQHSRLRLMPQAASGPTHRLKACEG